MTDIRIHEVGLRDGLQIEKRIVPLEKKIEWLEGLLAAGIDMIQLGSFVNPEKVPQMAGNPTSCSNTLPKPAKSLPGPFFPAWS